MLMEIEDLRVETKETIDVQTEILTISFVLHKNLKFLTTEQPTEIATIIKSHSFFAIAGLSMWDTLILSLEKLFGNKSDYSLVKILRRLIQEKNNDFSQRLEELASAIESDEIQSILQNLKEVRDKQTAHLDRNRYSNPVIVHLDDTKVLLSMGQDIISEVNRSLHGFTSGFEHQIFGLCEPTIMKLVNCKNIRN